MHKTVYQRLNFVYYVLIAIVLTILQSTIFTFFPFNWFHPDFGFILALYFGYRKGLIEGGLLTCITSLIVEIHTSSIPFFFFTLYLYVFLLSKLLSKVFVGRNVLTSLSGMGAAIFTLYQFGCLAMFYSMGKLSNAVTQQLLHFIPSLVTQILFISIMFKIFHKLDLATFSDIHSEDEYDLNKEF